MACGLPFLAVLGPLIVWQIKRDELERVERQGREALNFQLNVLFWSGLLFISCIGALLLPVLMAANVVLCVIGAVRAADGHDFRYPWIVRPVGPSS